MADSPLKAQLRSDMTASMKAGTKERTATLRLLIAAVMAEEKAGDTAIELDDNQVQAVLRRQLKQRTESIEAYTSGGRPEQAAAEQAEADLIATYLPAAMTDAELEAKVDSALAEAGITEMAQMGAAMKAVMGALGSDVDGKKVSALVRSRLSA